MSRKYTSGQQWSRCASLHSHEPYHLARLVHKSNILHILHVKCDYKNAGFNQKMYGLGDNSWITLADECVLCDWLTRVFSYDLLFFIIFNYANTPLDQSVFPVKRIARLHAEYRCTAAFRI